MEFDQTLKEASSQGPLQKNFFFDPIGSRRFWMADAFSTSPYRCMKICRNLKGKKHSKFSTKFVFYLSDPSTTIAVKGYDFILHFNFY